MNIQKRSETKKSRRKRRKKNKGNPQEKQKEYQRKATGKLKTTIEN